MTTLIFDGRFKPTDFKYASSGTKLYEKVGNWSNVCANPQIPGKTSYTIVPALRRQGEYAAHITPHPGYGCSIEAQDNHCQFMVNTLGIRNGSEEFIGFSIMLDPATVWPGTDGYDMTDAYWFDLGIELLSGNWAQCTQPGAHAGEIRGGYMLPKSEVIKSGYSNNTYLWMSSPDCENNVWPTLHTLMSPGQYIKGIWHDWIYHVKWSTTTTGFIHIYHKTETQVNYTEITTSSTHNIKTKKNKTPTGLDTGDIEHRFGIYQSRNAPSHGFWCMDYKVGITWNDVARTSSLPCLAPICDYTITQQL